MQFYEPTATAFLLTALGILMGVSALFSRAAGRFGVPVALLFILLGMLGGSEGLGGIAFENYGFTFRLGNVALVLILFDGGLNTPLSADAPGPQARGGAGHRGRHGHGGRHGRGRAGSSASSGSRRCCSGPSCPPRTRRPSSPCCAAAACTSSAAWA